jgi:hypothetical protein
MMLAVALAATSSLGTGIAAAATWTVDDDKAQCPSAGFTSIQAAVDQAAPHDTILICDGTYAEQSTPATSAASFAQAGSRNGLTITKPLTIKGTGASKVIIMPAPALGATLAGTVPYLRDGGGNVITISRQSLGASDSNENAVDISGVTVTSPSAYAEAGIAFFNTGGSVANSTIGPLTRAVDGTAFAAAPHGWGVIQTNSLQGAGEGTVRRDVTLTNDLITGYQAGGVLIDDGRGADGDAANTTRAGIAQYGKVVNTRVVGVGATAIFPQTGIKYTNGARGSVTGSEIANNRYSTDPRQSAGLLLTDAASGTDPRNPALPAFAATTNSFTGNGYGVFNADAANSAVRLAGPVSVNGGWFGCAAGPLVGTESSFTGPTNGCQGISGDDSAAAASVTGAAATAAPAALVVPGATSDAAPTGALVSGDFTVLPGQTLHPVVQAADDFGVKKVAVLLDGTTIATKTTVPYELAPIWTPTAKDAGKVYSLTAQVTDSAGRVTTTAPTTVTVAGAPFAALVAGAGSWAAGDVTVGSSATQTLTFSNADDAAMRLGDVRVSGAGFSVTGGTCVAGKVLAPAASCTVGVAFAPDAAGAVSGTLTVTPLGAAGAAAVALSGTGVARATEATPPPPPAPAPPATPMTPKPGQTPAPKTIGAVSVAFVKAPKLASTGAITLGTFACESTCTVKLTGALTVNGKRTTFTVTRTLSPGKATTLKVTLSSAARKALKKAGKGTLSVRVAQGGKSKVSTFTVTG